MINYHYLFTNAHHSLYAWHCACVRTRRTCNGNKNKRETTEQRPLELPFIAGAIALLLTLCFIRMLTKCVLCYVLNADYD